MPTIVFESENVQIEYGSVGLEKAESDIKTPLLHFRFNQGGGVLAGIGPQGLRELPGDVPAIWVVAPTQEQTGIGFAVNGRFEVDAGRTRLSSNDEANENESRRIGCRLAEGLSMLFDEGEIDWDGFKERMLLESNLRPYDFWASVWRLFSEPLTRRLDGKVENILDHILAGERGLGRLVRDREALPNGLWGTDFQKLTCAGRVKVVLRGALSEERNFIKISDWDLFRQKVESSEVVSSEVFQALRKTNPEFAQEKNRWQSLKLGGVLNWLNVNDYRATIETASVLGRIISPEFLNELKSTEAGNNEVQEISGVLRMIKFQTKSGRWREPKTLLSTWPIAEKSEDERLRASFAPPEQVLSENYTHEGVAFFAACRSKMEAPVDDMVNWVLDASETETRRAALRYLLEGELGDRLSRRLRDRGTPIVPKFGWI